MLVLDVDGVDGGTFFGVDAGVGDAESEAARLESFGRSIDAIRSVLRSFPGLEHALEVVRERRGVRYVNDSKGTNVDAVLKALEGIEQPIWLIVGGRDKGGDFSRLEGAIRERVKGLILIGEAAGRIQAAMGNFDRCRPAATLRDAVELAAREAQPGEVVLLSPACASFDMFAEIGRAHV